MKNVVKSINEQSSEKTFSSLHKPCANKLLLKCDFETEECVEFDCVFYGKSQVLADAIANEYKKLRGE